jgi:membrane protein DedA with SNARE-associated domain
MIDLSGLFLSGMLTYGIWALGLATLVSAIGVPLPATMILLAAGAFARQGVLHWQSAVALAALGAMLGDTISYLLARFGGKLAFRRVQNPGDWGRSQKAFERWGGLAVFFSRFLLTPLALPINLLAGSTRYTLWRYTGLVVGGEALWVATFGGLGYLFADRWEAVSTLMSSLSGAVAAAALGLAGAGYLLRRAWLRRRDLRSTIQRIIQHAARGDLCASLNPQHAGN